MTGKLPIHPEAVPGDPQAVRWVVPTGGVPVGEVRGAPGSFGSMLEYGVISRAMVEADGVWTWLASDQAWSRVGSKVRDAIVASLAEEEGWDVEPGSADLLGYISRDVVEHQLAAYIASHGGQIQVVDNDAETVEVDFGGACQDCPAAGQTLHQRIETAIRARYPQLKTVKRVGDTGKKKRGITWLSLPGHNCLCRVPLHVGWGTLGRGSPPCFM